MHHVTFPCVWVSDASEAAIYLNWDWHWSFKSLTIENCPVGVDVGSQTGSLTIFDSVFRNVSTAAVRTSFTYSSDEQRMKAERAKVAGLTSVNSLVLDNVQVRGCFKEIVRISYWFFIRL